MKNLLRRPLYHLVNTCNKLGLILESDWNLILIPIKSIQLNLLLLTSPRFAAQTLFLTTDTNIILATNVPSQLLLSQPIEIWILMKDVKRQLDLGWTMSS